MDLSDAGEMLLLCEQGLGTRIWSET